MHVTRWFHYESQVRLKLRLSNGTEDLCGLTQAS